MWTWQRTRVRWLTMGSNTACCSDSPPLSTPVARIVLYLQPGPLSEYDLERVIRRVLGCVGDGDARLQQLLEAASEADGQDPIDAQLQRARAWMRRTGRLGDTYDLLPPAPSSNDADALADAGVPVSGARVAGVDQSGACPGGPSVAALAAHD